MNLTLNIKGLWESSPLPVLLVVAWLLLWWRGSRGIRLWFVGLAPFGALGGVVLGLLADLGARGPGRPVSCTPALCGDWGGVTAYRDATSGPGRLIFGNSLLALIVAVALGVLTLVVELLLAGARTTLRLRTSGTGPSGRGQRPGSACGHQRTGRFATDPEQVHRLLGQVRESTLSSTLNWLPIRAHW